MKSLMQLIEHILADASIWCRTSTARDFKRISSRVEHEGLSFLTITLPAFCKDFESCLEKGFLDSTCFKFHKKEPKHGIVPVLFLGFSSLVFDTSTGKLLDIPDTNAIFAIRQLCLVLKKLELPCSNKRIHDAFAQYVKCEQELESLPFGVPKHLFEMFRSVSKTICTDTLQDVERTFYDVACPSQGKGTTAEGITSNQKYVFQSWHERLEPFFPSCDYILPNAGMYRSLDCVKFLEPDAEPPVRVVSVPKTLKTPRIIGIEPVCMQYTQQALLPLYVKAIESGSMTRNRINFSSQGQNRRLAKYSSVTQRLATMDLKDASDRVSCWLVDCMLSGVPNLRDATMACRSIRSEVPGYGILTLTKFASMGSALCFPIEALMFFCIVATAGLLELNLRPTARNIKHVTRGVRVYGDDIIVPVELVHACSSLLETFGLKVNRNKTFVTGKFRESCGKDYYCGVLVTPVHCNTFSPRNRDDASAILSWISMSNLFYEAGYWKTAQFCRDLVENLKIPIPIVERTSPIVGRFSYAFRYKWKRYCDRLHRPLLKGVVSRSVAPKSVIDGLPALLKCLLKKGLEPFHDVKHLVRQGRPKSVDIKIRWATPF